MAFSHISRRFILLIITTTALSFGCEKSPQDVPLTVEDIDGNVYHTVKIGKQVWLAENLRVTRYNDGTPIQNVSHPDPWGDNEDPRFCWVNGDSIQNAEKYGALYSWNAALDIRIAPEGWRVPTIKEVEELGRYIGERCRVKRGVSYIGTPIIEIEYCNAASRLMDNSGSEWICGSSSIDNSSGFKAYPASIVHNIHSAFLYPHDTGFGNEAVWWCWNQSDLYGSDGSCFYVHCGSQNMRTSNADKNYGLSVRLIMD